MRETMVRYGQITASLQLNSAVPNRVSAVSTKLLAGNAKTATVKAEKEDNSFLFQPFSRCPEAATIAVLPCVSLVVAAVVTFAVSHRRTIPKNLGDTPRNRKRSSRPTTLGINELFYYVKA